MKITKIVKNKIDKISQVEDINKKKKPEKYTVRNMFDDLKKWENFLKNLS